MPLGPYHLNRIWEGSPVSWKWRSWTLESDQHSPWCAQSPPLPTQAPSGRCVWCCCVPTLLPSFHPNTHTFVAPSLGGGSPRSLWWRALYSTTPGGDSPRRRAVHSRWDGLVQADTQLANQTGSHTQWPVPLSCLRQFTAECVCNNPSRNCTHRAGNAIPRKSPGLARSILEE